MTRKSKSVFSLIALLYVVFCFQSCAEPPIFDENKDITEHNWDFKNPVSFDVNIADTTKYCNMYINLRITSDYKYSNMFMWVTETLPDKSTQKERMEFTLQDERGKWFGKGLGDIYEYQLQYKPRIKFKQKGIYTFSLEQNMRDEVLANVVSAGVRVEFWSQESKAW
jgi:gliding motility-associated lipoprotein GldH